jgi:hypothetical protein
VFRVRKSGTGCIKLISTKKSITEQKQDPGSAC